MAAYILARRVIDIEFNLADRATRVRIAGCGAYREITQKVVLWLGVDHRRHHGAERTANRSRRTIQAAHLVIHRQGEIVQMVINQVAGETLGEAHAQYTSLIC